MFFPPNTGPYSYLQKHLTHRDIPREGTTCTKQINLMWSTSSALLDGIGFWLPDHIVCLLPLPSNILQEEGIDAEAFSGWGTIMSCPIDGCKFVSSEDLLKDHLKSLCKFSRETYAKYNFKGRSPPSGSVLLRHSKLT